MKNVKVLIDRLRLRTPASHGYQPLMEEAADAIEALCSNPTPSSILGGIETALRECEEYFDQRADADLGEGIPNEEMNLLHVVRTALALIGMSAK